MTWNLPNNVIKLNRNAVYKVCEDVLVVPRLLIICCAWWKTVVQYNREWINHCENDAYVNFRIFKHRSC